MLGSFALVHTRIWSRPSITLSSHLASRDYYLVWYEALYVIRFLAKTVTAEIVVLTKVSSQS